MKILMLIDSLGIGGAETHVETLSLELKRCGHEVKIATSGGEIATRLQKQGVVILSVPDFLGRGGEWSAPLVLNGMLLAQFWGARRKIRRYIESEMPDVVHSHTRRMAFLAKNVCRRRKIPLVTTAHAMFSMKFPRRFLSCWGDRTIAVSDDIKRHLVSHGVPENQIEIVENGVKFP